MHGGRLRSSALRSSSALRAALQPDHDQAAVGGEGATLRARYFAPMLSRMTSAPWPSVASRTRSTKSCSR